MTHRPKSDFLEVMVARGYLQDCTDLAGLDERLLAGIVPAYIGYDATAQSLHVGHLLNIMMLRWLQKTGHKPITLMGGGTTKVGDPSFRDDERPLLTPEQIDANIATIRGVFEKYLDYSDAPPARSCSTTPSGWTASTTSASCATSAAISRSTGCSPSRASSRGWTATSR